MVNQNELIIVINDHDQPKGACERGMADLLADQQDGEAVSGLCCDGPGNLSVNIDVPDRKLDKRGCMSANRI